MPEHLWKLIPDDLICVLRCCCIKVSAGDLKCRLRCCCCRWNRPSSDSGIDGCESSFDLALVLFRSPHSDRSWSMESLLIRSSVVASLPSISRLLFNVGSRRIKMMEPRCWSWSWRSIGCLLSAMVDGSVLGIRNIVRGWKRGLAFGTSLSSQEDNITDNS